MARSMRFEVRLAECNIRETKFVSPIGTSCRFIVASMEVQTEFELDCRIEKASCPFDEQPECRWIGVREIDEVPRLRALGPVHDNTGHEERISKMVQTEVLGFGANPLNLLAAPPLCVDGNASTGSGSGATLDAPDLFRGQLNVSHPR